MRKVDRNSYILDHLPFHLFYSCCTPCLPQNAPTSLKEILEQLLDALVSYTEPTGRLVSELFQKLPSKMVRSC